jgi:hypothetical protein
MSNQLTFQTASMGTGLAIVLWRLVRLFRTGKADVLFGFGRSPSSVGREHPFFWAHVIVLIALALVGFVLLLHFWNLESAPK